MSNFNKGMALTAILIISILLVVKATGQEETDQTFLGQGQQLNPWQPVIVSVMGPLQEGISEEAYQVLIQSFEDVGAALERGRIRAQREAGLIEPLEDSTDER